MNYNLESIQLFIKLTLIRLMPWKLEFLIELP